MAKKIFILDTGKIEKDFNKGQIIAYAKEIGISDIGALAYLYFYNNVSVAPKDLMKDCGRPMYRKFACGLNEMLLEYSDLNTKDAEKILEELEKTQKQYDEVVEQNRNLQAELTPFRHSYFKGLDTNTIAELAKKSIRITAYNIEAEDLIECIYNTIGNAGEANALRIIKQAIEKYRGQNANK